MGLSQELQNILFWIAIGNPSRSCGSQTHCSMASRSRKSGNPYSVLSTMKLIFSLNVIFSCINLFSPCLTLLCIPTPLHLEYLLHTNREYSLQGLTYHIFLQQQIKCKTKCASSNCESEQVKGSGCIDIPKTPCVHDYPGRWQGNTALKWNSKLVWLHSGLCTCTAWAQTLQTVLT